MCWNKKRREKVKSVVRNCNCSSCQIDHSFFVMPFSVWNMVMKTMNLLYISFLDMFWCTVFIFRWLLHFFICSLTRQHSPFFSLSFFFFCHCQWFSFCFIFPFLFHSVLCCIACFELHLKWKCISIQNLWSLMQS